MCDYFGLQGSESDNEEEIDTSIGKVLCDAYQVTDQDYGPQIEDPNIKNPLKREIDVEESNETRLKKFKINDDENNKPILTPERQQSLKYGRKSLTGHISCINRLEWSTTNFLLSASVDKTIKIWNPEQEKYIYSINDHVGGVRDAAWSFDGTKILSGSYDKSSLVIDVRTQTILNKYSHENWVTAVKWKPNDENVFITCSEGVVNAWDLRQENPVKCYQFKYGQVLDVIFINDGKEFLCSTDVVAHDSADKTIMAWDFDSTALLSNQIYNERYTCPRLAAHPKGNKFVAQSNGQYIAEFSTTRPYKMNRKKRFEGHKVTGHNVGCDFNASGRYLYSGSADGILYCYEFRNGCLRKRLPIFSKEVLVSVACHPVLDFTIALSSWSGKIQIMQ